MKVPYNIDIIAVIVTLFDEVSLDCIENGLLKLNSQENKEAFSAYLYDYLGRNIGSKMLSKKSFTLVSGRYKLEYQSAHSFITWFKIYEDDVVKIDWKLND